MFLASLPSLSFSFIFLIHSAECCQTLNTNQKPPITSDFLLKKGKILKDNRFLKILYLYSASHIISISANKVYLVTYKNTLSSII